MGVFDAFRIFRVNKSISIDLGTANILIYDKQRKKIVLNEPSVVARDRKTRKIIAALPSSIMYVFFAPFTASNNAFLSTLVTSIGTQIITSGLNNEFP